MVVGGGVMGAAASTEDATGGSVRRPRVGLPCYRHDAQMSTGLTAWNHRAQRRTGKDRDNGTRGQSLQALRGGGAETDTRLNARCSVRWKTSVQSEAARLERHS